jgi:hypothetical protein
LLTLLSPDFFGNPAQNNFWGYDNYWENAAYIGVMPLLLATWAVWRTLRGESANRRAPALAPQRSAGASVGESLVTHHSSLVTFFSISVFISLLLAFGRFTPIYPFLYQSIPGFDLFQGPARWLMITMPAVCALAGIGAQHWIERGFSRRVARRWTLIGIALCLAGAASLFIFKGPSATFGPAILRLGVLLVIVSLLFKSPIANYPSQIIIVLVLALDLITAHFALNPSLPPNVYHEPNPAAEAIRADGNRGRVFYLDADEEAVKFGQYLAHDKKFDGYGPADLGYWLGAREALLPNSAMIDGVPSANNFDSLIVGRYQNVLDKINALPIDEALPLLGRMNVAYLVSPRALDLPIVYRGRDVTIYRNPAALPRAWVASIDSNLTQVSNMRAGSSIESLTDSGNTVTIRAASSGDGWLILSDTWYPGWSATVDGEPTDIQLANETFRAVKFPAGVHQVEFQYAPMSLQLGEVMSLASAVVIIIGLATSNRRTTNQRINKSTN